MSKSEIPGNLQLRGRVILVTGAGCGLGRAYAAALCRLGAHVVVHDAGVNQHGTDPDPTCAEEAVEALRADGGSALPLTTLLQGAASCRRTVEDALAWRGRLDDLIHNAGVVVWRDPVDVDEAVYAAVSGVNSDAAFWLCSAALPAMRRQGFGRIVLTTSGWALSANTGADELALYCHGKGAQLGLAMALARGVGHPDIRTNVIAPVAKTRIYRGDVPQDRLRPESVAGTAAWLVSPACALTGWVVRVGDGTVELVRLASVASRDLGAAAADPASAGAALEAMAATAAPGP